MSRYRRLRRLRAMSQKRILIVGGGFAGVHAAIGAVEVLRSASGSAVSVELVSPEPDLVIRPRLYESDLSGARVPLTGVLGSIGVRHRCARVTEIDVERRTVQLDDRREPVGFDQLVVAAGGRLALPAGTEVHSADTYTEAVALRRAIGSVAREGDPRPGVIVVGGGFTGLELSAEIASGPECAARSVTRPTGAHVMLIEQRRELAPDFGPRARAVIDGALRALGVEVRTGVQVSEARSDGVVLDSGERLDAKLVVWSAGPRASALTDQIPGRRDRLGRLHVDRFLATEVEGIWACGDCAAARVDREHVAVMSCQQAMPQGRRAGENAALTLLGRPPRGYRQSLYLTCLDLGAFGALLTCGFERNTILAAGPGAKEFKRYINRSRIYPPASSDPERVLEWGRTPPSGSALAALSRLALRSSAIRRRITGSAEDRASVFGTSADVDADLSRVAA